jgi:hypothetical protein
LVRGKGFNVDRVKTDRSRAPRQVSNTQCEIVCPERKNAERRYPD